ncbi:MAG: hypothetical protein AAGB15_04795 [Pseudomonadota bacterium]
MFNKTETEMAIDQATIDYYVAKGKRERSRAFVAMIKELFSAPEEKPVETKKVCTV